MDKDFPERVFKRILVDIDSNYLEAMHAVRGGRSFTEALNEAVYDWVVKATANRNITPAGKF